VLVLVLVVTRAGRNADADARGKDDERRQRTMSPTGHVEPPLSVIGMLDRRRWPVKERVPARCLGPSMIGHLKAESSMHNRALPTEDRMDKRDHKQRYDSGLKTRREVLGAGYVDKAMSGVDEFSQEFTEMLNTYCWNDIWNRPGLPRKMRSVLNLGMLCALGKEHELKLHIRGALNNGLTKDEIKEVFLQVAIYCGVPAAVVAFRAAREVFQSEK
jgi:4-carboxymuconolactone decarboxylase